MAAAVNRMGARLAPDAGWQLPSAGFANPGYLGPNGLAAGFDIAGGTGILLIFSGTYSGQTVVHEQTLDAEGATGWFPVVGQLVSAAPTTPASTFATSGQAYAFPAMGIRHRVRVTALSTGTMVLFAGLLQSTFDLPNVGGGGGGGNTTVTATAASPSYVEGSSTNPLSSDLSGNLRVVVAGGVAVGATATAAAPTYVEGSSNPLSQNLTGDLRTIAKQSGSWTVAATQSGTWNIGSIANALPAGSNIIGNVRIDQTTPGTTNGVVPNGNVASGVADAGNPIKMGAVARSAAPSAVDAGDRVDLSADLFGSLRILVTDIAGAALDYSAPAVTEGPATAGTAVGAFKPVLGGGQARTTNPTAASDGQIVRLTLDKLGRTVTSPHQIRELVADAAATITSSTSAATLVAATASTYNDLISITLVNTSATGTVVQILDDDGSTVRWTGYAPPTDMRGIVFPVVLKQAATNVTWKWKTVTSVASVTATVQVVKNT